jgi:methionyl-tRNA formyltransferase
MTETPSSQTYLVAGMKPWNRRIFDEQIAPLPGSWSYISHPNELKAAIAETKPRYIFFLHWSAIVPKQIVEQYECVCFHMADVPYGRGGSPLQNLIARGHRDTVLTALRMVAALDAGPVYMKEPLSLEGGAEEIYIRATRLSARMIARIISEQPQPSPQEGEPVVFSRRKPEESEVSDLGSLEALHDLIRMLDAEGYPRAFLSSAGYRFEFSRPALYDGRIVADVTITRPEVDK